MEEKSLCKRKEWPDNFIINDWNVIWKMATTHVLGSTVLTIKNIVISDAVILNAPEQRITKSHDPVSPMGWSSSMENRHTWSSGTILCWGSNLSTISWFLATTTARQTIWRATRKKNNTIRITSIMLLKDDTSSSLLGALLYIDIILNSVHGGMAV